MTPVMKMIATQARKMTSLFIEKGVIAGEDREVYDYCFDLLLSTAILLLAMTAIAIRTGTVIQTLCFLAAFRMTRHSAGGYHAGSEVTCLIMTLGIYAAFLGLMKYLPAEVITGITPVAGTAAAVLIWKYAPVGCLNRPLEGREAERLKRKSRRMILILLGCIAGLMIFRQTRTAFAISCGTGIAALSLAAGRRILRKSAAARKNEKQ